MCNFTKRGDHEDLNNTTLTIKSTRHSYQRKISKPQVSNKSLQLILRFHEEIENTIKISAIETWLFCRLVVCNFWFNGGLDTASCPGEEKLCRHQYPNDLCKSHSLSLAFYVYWESILHWFLNNWPDYKNVGIFTSRAPLPMLFTVKVMVWCFVSY